MKSSMRTCKNCSREFEVPPTAEHKRFCSSTCRAEWHEKRRKAALELLAKKEQKR